MELWDVAVLAALLLARDRLRADGQLFALYLALYGAGKFTLSFLRVETVWVAGLQEAQLLAIAAIAVARALGLLAACAGYSMRRPRSMSPSRPAGPWLVTGRP